MNRNFLNALKKFCDQRTGLEVRKLCPSPLPSQMVDLNLLMTQFFTCEIRTI